ncbi:MAG: hypothetical protein KatS3mg110_3743 [Pirellulaceae bacterium]|nr:MAG: hypothetical protein KatS3mg110_3735 [Pirellulaceae bacterium]GIW95702.1 MAG: hypothetical protein KatS3mg110_3743 [Pirellulaceae bacterium]
MAWDRLQIEPTWMFLAGILLASFVMIRLYIIRSRRAARKSSQLQATPDFSRRDPFLGAPQELVRWQVEMHEIARDAKAELDTKMRALQVLIRDACDCEARLRALINRLEAVLEKEGSEN